MAQPRLKVGILGATGMVGSTFPNPARQPPLVYRDPWSRRVLLPREKRTPTPSKGRWALEAPIPDNVKKLIVKDASRVSEIASQVDFVFCAVDMPKEDILALEEAYAKAETPVVSNNSAHRMTADVPMIVPELNPEHALVIPAQRKRLGTKGRLYHSEAKTAPSKAMCPFFIPSESSD